MAINVGDLPVDQQITAIYVAYFDRAPDPAGLQYWIDQAEAGQPLAEIAENFARGAEAILKYPYLATPDVASPETFITNIYVNLFNRTPDAEGLAYWSGQLADGYPIGKMVLAILNGAQSAAEGGFPDAETITNKIEVGLDWAQAAAEVGVGTPGNLIAADVDGELEIYDPDSFVSATTILDGVTGDEGSVTDAQAAIAEFFEQQIIGETFNLTTGVDNVEIDTLNTIDTVRGVMNDDGGTDADTFSAGDRIEGNGLTVVEIALIDGNNADFVEMEGVNALSFRGAGETSQVNFDASSYGSDLNKFTLSGADSADADVDNVEFDDGALEFEIVDGTTGTLDVTGEAGPFTSFSVDLETTGEGVWLISDIGNTGISAYAGEDGDVEFDADIDITETSADVTIDALLIGDVSLVAAGTDSTVDVSISLSAEANTTGSASVGDVTVGMLDMIAGDAASGTFELYRYAYADEGHATIGNLIMGDVSLSGTAEDAEHYVYISASAAVQLTGDATVGDTTVGNLDIVMVDDAYEATFSMYNYAYADTGNAVVGDLLIGDITVDAGSSVTQDIYVQLSQSATASVSGDATVGDITAGNVNVMLGDSTDMTMYAYLEVDADSGDATAGSIAIGDVTVGLGEEAEFSLYASAEADADTGDTAAVGDVTIGNITLTQDSGAEAYIYAYAYATATGDGNGTVGNLSVGDVTSVMGIDTTLEIYVSASAYGSGTMTSIGDVSVGNITLSGSVAIDADALLSVTMQADGPIGSVTVGDVDVDFLGGSSFDYYVYLSTSGSDEVIGAVNLGDVDIVAEDIEYEFSMYGDMSAGVTVGDVMLSGEDVDWESIYLYAQADIGDVNIGNIMIDAETNITVQSGIYISGTDDVGNVTVGDVSIDAPNAETFDIYVYADDDLGNVDVGDLDLAARSGLFAMDVTVSANEDAGTVTVGDVSLSAVDGATASADIDVNAGNELGDVTVGDVTLAATVSATANSAFANFFAESESGLTVGDITVGASYTGAADVAAAPVGAVDFDVDLFASDDLTIGDITISGGIIGTGTAMDNLAVLTGWLDATAGGTVTVGDIDYSAYEADATIDVSGFEGAANITAGSGDTNITVNDTQNTVTLGDGDDTVFYTAEEQSGTTYADIDKIIGFSSGDDMIDFQALAGGALSGIDIGGTVADYDTFLTVAQAAMTFDNYDVFAMTDGTNTYVAVNSDNDPNETIDFVIELTGVTSVATGDFAL